jgi:hypothetical protein
MSTESSATAASLSLMIADRICNMSQNLVRQVMFILILIRENRSHFTLKKKQYEIFMFVNNKFDIRNFIPCPKGNPFNSINNHHVPSSVLSATTPTETLISSLSSATTVSSTNLLYDSLWQEPHIYLMMKQSHH